MVWVNEISKLQYYNQPSGVPCYCETLTQPYDVLLQGTLDTNGDGSYTAVITLYTPDGITDLGDVTSYFDIYYATLPNGRHYFTARLKNFAPAMCANVCWIVRVSVDTNFDYYTERYCAPSCCQVASGVTIGTTGISPYMISPSGNVIIAGNNDDGDQTGVAVSSNPVVSDCGFPLIELITFSDCYSNFTGKRYKKPNTTLSGTSFDYVNKSYIPIKVDPIPTTIERTYSVNCRLQRVTKYSQYKLYAFQLFPKWKMLEMQDWFTDQYIFINGERYEMDSGELFEEVVIQNDCTPLYRLKAVLRDCEVKQIHGCGDICTDNSAAFVFGDNIQGTGGYFTENKQYIGSTCDDIMNYYRAQQGVTSVEALDPMDYDCDFACGFVVYGLSDAYIPTKFFYGSTMAANAVFGQDPNNLPVCEQITPACTIPVIGNIENNASVCETPVIGVITNTEITPVELYMNGFEDWVLIDAGSDATLAGNTVTINIEVENSTITYDSGDPDAVFPVFGGQIGYISEAGWPTVNKTISNEDLTALGATLYVSTTGQIVFNGQVSAADLTKASITITNIIYTI